MKLNETKYLENPFFKTNKAKLPFLVEGEAEYLDEEYFYGHSYDKDMSYRYKRIVDVDGETLALTHIYKIALIRFKTKWDRLYKTMVYPEYDITSNTKVTEKENIGTKVTTSTSTDSDVYGFNSEGAVSVSDTHGKTQSVSDKVDNERETTRYGNNGAKTFAELIANEIEFKNRYEFYQMIFNDIDELLCSRYIR